MSLLQRAVEATRESSALAASLAYDYSRIPNPEDREALRSAALDIKPRLKRVVGDIVETGRQLLEVRDRCPHGQWGEWLGTEFDLSETMARNWMNSAERFAGKSANFADLPLSALYQLAAPSTPPAAVAAIEQRVIGGERVKLAEVKATIAEHKPAPPPPPAPTGRCARCGRELTDPAAIAAGIGACCARKPAGGEIDEDLSIADLRRKEARPQQVANMRDALGEALTAIESVKPDAYALGITTLEIAERVLSNILDGLTH